MSMCTLKTFRRLRRQVADTILAVFSRTDSHVMDVDGVTADGAAADQQGENNGHGQATAEEPSRFERVADDYPDVFREPTGMPPERDIEHRIELEQDSRRSPVDRPSGQ